MNACDAKNGKVLFSHNFPQSPMHICAMHGLRTPKEGINQRYLKNWADVADKICFGHTYLKIWEWE